MNKIVCSAIAALLLGVVENANASLVAYWGFNETNGLTAIDSISGVNGTLVGGATFTPKGGILGGAVQITDGYVNMGNNFASSDSFSIQTWVKIDAGDISPMTPVAKHWSTVGQGYYLSVNNVVDGYTQTNLAGFRSIGGRASQTAIGGPLINDGAWHQLLGTYDNGLTSIYVDGSLAGLGSGGNSDNSADFIETTTIDLRQSFPDTQGDNGFFAYGYATNTNTYRLLTDAGSNHFNTPEEGNWNNPHVGGAGSPYDWYSAPWINLFPSGTASNIGAPEDAVLAWVVPKTASYQLTGAYYVPAGSLNGADAYIKKNDVILWSSYLSPGTNLDFDVASTILNVGDNIYFGVGAHNDVYFSEYNDWPFLRGQIIATPMPITNIDRHQFAAGVIGNKIYVTGGYDVDDIYTPIKTTEMLDLTTSAWTSLADFESYNGHGLGVASGATMQGRFYVVGLFGSNYADGMTNFIQEYDPDNNIWTSKSPMSSAHIMSTAVEYNDEIFVFGGAKFVKNKKTVTARFYKLVDAYKPATNT